MPGSLDRFGPGAEGASIEPDVQEGGRSWRNRDIAGSTKIQGGEPAGRASGSAREAGDPWAVRVRASVPEPVPRAAPLQGGE